MCIQIGFVNLALFNQSSFQYDQIKKINRFFQAYNLFDNYNFIFEMQIIFYGKCSINAGRFKNMCIQIGFVNLALFNQSSFQYDQIKVLIYKIKQEDKSIFSSLQFI
ncbi:hypothetical protein pb186bvf_001879 [Paramecium bursaria]